jgi:hypothetical protein
MPSPSSVLRKVQPIDQVPHNSQQSRQGQFNSSIEMLRHAKQERTGRSSSRGPSAQVGNRAEVARGVPAGEGDVDLSEDLEV